MKRLILELLLVVLATCAPHATAQTGPTPAPNRVLDPIDETQLVTLRGNTHPMARAQFDRGAAPGSMPSGRIRMVLERSAAQQRALTQYLSDLQSPASPNYQKWLTPAQYGDAYGASESDLLRVLSWLQSHGFRIEKVPKAHDVIEFSGTFDQVQNAFHTAIHTFLVNGETHFANVGDPQIPAALAPVIAGIGPLNDFHAKPMMVRGPEGRFDPSSDRIVPELTLTSNNTPYLFVDPADAAVIYDTPNRNLNPAYSGTTYDGTGVSIGIAGVSDLTSADVANYRVAFLGEAPGSVNLPTVVVDGNDPGLNGAGTEALLDNEVAGGIAPKAKIYFYTSADTDISSGLLNAIFRALDDNTVSILSISFSNCEADLGAAGNPVMLEAAEEAAAQGITFIVAAGDNGSAGCDDFDTEQQAQQGFGVNGYASTPYSIAVGGTDFDALSTSFASYVNSNTGGAPPYYGTALKYIPENPWNDSTSVDTTYLNDVANKNSNGVGNIAAASGGVSSVYAKPAFQSSMTPNDGFRDLPDVSLLAGNGMYDAAWVICSDNVTDGVTSEAYTDCLTTGGQFTSSTYFGGVGGTSASAQAFAGMLALVAQAHGSASDNYRLGQADNVLYQLAQSKYSAVFHDIPTGNNSVACTSGSPDCGSNLFLTGYNAGTGYDLASGLGSVNVAEMVSNWNSVSLATTSTSLKIDGSAAAYTGVHGQSLTFDVGVSPATTSGVVGIVDNANETNGGTEDNGQFAIPLIGGAGSATYNGLPGGSYTVWARYGGDTANASSTSTPITVSISAEPSTTTLTINAYDPTTGKPITSNIPYGSNYIFADAIVTGTNEGTNTQGVATGEVWFQINGASLENSATVVSSGNVASWPPLNGPYPLLPAGSNVVTGQYSGDASYLPSTGTATITISKAPTTLSVSSSAASTIGQGVTITAEVADQLPSTIESGPSGQATFTDTTNNTILGTSYVGISGCPGVKTTCSGGFLAVQSTQLVPGANSIVATYPGDSNFIGSNTKASVSVTCNASCWNASGERLGLGFYSESSGTIAAGGTITTSVDVEQSGGFAGNVNLTCSVSGQSSNDQNIPTCSFNPTSVAVTSQAVSSVLTIKTTAPTTTSSAGRTIAHAMQASGDLVLSCGLLLLVPGLRRHRKSIGAVLILVILMTWMTACGGGGGGAGGGSGGGGGVTTIPGTTSDTYTVNFRAADAATGTVTAQDYFTFVVN